MKINLTEENPKSKHPDSFRILKGYGYNLLYSDQDGEEYYRQSSGHKLNINSKGQWKAFSPYLSVPISKGSTHIDLEHHLDRTHG